MTDIEMDELEKEIVESAIVNSKKAYQDTLDNGNSV